jgi:GIY-YIG catalytic domain-containing protein
VVAADAEPSDPSSPRGRPNLEARGPTPCSFTTMLRDRLLARLNDMGASPDYIALARDVLAIRVNDPALARTLVEQALVVEDRQEAWRALGDRIRRELPDAAGVYVMLDERGRAVYVGKAANLRRRVSSYFAARQWRKLPPGLMAARAIQWDIVGSDLEALLREAALIDDLAPPVNAQLAAPRRTLARRPATVRDVIVVLPSVEEDSAVLVCARIDGRVWIQRTRRSGADLMVHGQRVLRFFRTMTPNRPAADERPHAAIVFAWLATPRGRRATRLDPRDIASPADLRARLRALLADEALFVERIDQR